ncbi:MAG: 3-keto-disaccharide hydrolase [Mongoliitalea sp.]
MIKQLIIGLLLLCFVKVAHAQDEFISLFNGKDLEGWQAFGTERWYVENGLLISESGPDKDYGYLGTVQQFKDFEFEAEFKQEADGNSGIFIRSTVDGTKVSGWQVEVAPPGHDTGGIYESYGRGWLIKPDPQKDVALRYGDWNHMRIVVKGDRVVSYLNGVEMVDYSDELIGKGEGSILLQIHDGGGIKIYWRDIRVKVL